MQQAILILFGWVLGVFSSIILENKKRKQAKEDYRESLFTEIDLVYPRIVCTYYSVINEMGELNKENLEWIRNIIIKKNNHCQSGFDDKSFFSFELVVLVIFLSSFTFFIDTAESSLITFRGFAPLGLPMILLASSIFMSSLAV